MADAETNYQQALTALLEFHEKFTEFKNQPSCDQAIENIERAYPELHTLLETEDLKRSTSSLLEPLAQKMGEFTQAKEDRAILVTALTALDAQITPLAKTANTLAQYLADNNTTPSITPRHVLDIHSLFQAIHKKFVNWEERVLELIVDLNDIYEFLTDVKTRGKGVTAAIKAFSRDEPDFRQNARAQVRDHLQTLSMDFMKLQFEAEKLRKLVDTLKPIIGVTPKQITAISERLKAA